MAIQKAQVDGIAWMINAMTYALKYRNCLRRWERHLINLIEESFMVRTSISSEHQKKSSELSSRLLVQE